VSYEPYGSVANKDTSVIRFIRSSFFVCYNKNRVNKNSIQKAATQTLRNFLRIIPIILGIFLLLSLITVAVPQEFYSKIFTNVPIIDAFIGAILGSILAGNPLTSYIIGGELLKQGVALVAVVAFLLGWVTVGIVQLPAESLMLGKRFAITRNIVSFILAILVAVLTIFTLGLI